MRFSVLAISMKFLIKKLPVLPIAQLMVIVQTLNLLLVQFVPSVYKTEDDEENPEDYLYLLDHLFFFPFSFVFFHYAAFLVRDFSLYIFSKSKDLICS